MTNFLKEKIVDKLDSFSEATLTEILEFVEFLEWRKQKNDRVLISENKQNISTEDES
jgi:hypothetical protein